ncbi:MAG: GNAT family N-acetyltransferase [Alphaproteobacteria bacterium]|nr:GNAT family N-acetyltransferase [Alphaproteobacteria bacterium]
MALAIRDAATDGRDEDFILALNAACTPAVSDLTRDDLREIAAAAHRVLVAESENGPCGFVILMRPAAPYPSDNYAWFERRFANHLYVDRIAIDASARGQGVGRALYGEAMKIAAANGDERITAEVNVEPPNPQSMSFHVAMGFRHLVTRPSRSGKIVAMLERPLDRR